MMTVSERTATRKEAHNRAASILLSMSAETYAEIVARIVLAIDRECCRRLAAGREDVYAATAVAQQGYLSCVRQMKDLLGLSSQDAVDDTLLTALFEAVMGKLRDEGDVVFVSDRQRIRSRVFEIVHYLRHLRQRTVRGDVDGYAPRLVEMLKVEVLPRQRPVRTVSIDEVISAADDVTASIAVDSSCHRSMHVTDVQAELADVFAEFLRESFGGAGSFAQFQLAAFRALLAAGLDPEREERAFAVAAGTGFGKTEAFLLPLLYYTTFRRFQKARAALDGSDPREGVDSILLYPRVDLCDNQVERVLQYVVALNSALKSHWREEYGKLEPVKVAISHSGINPAYRIRCPVCMQEKRQRGGAWTAQDDQAAFIRAEFEPGYGNMPRFKCFKCDRNPLGHQEAVDYLVHQTRRDSPQADIVITTVDTLHRRLMDIHGRSRIFNRRLWPPRYVVLDEMHIYEGQTGSHAAHVLRRCRQRILAMSEDNPPPVFVGASATAGSPAGLACRMFGVPERTVELIQPGSGPDEVQASGLEYYVFVQSPGNRVTGGAALAQVSGTDDDDWSDSGTVGSIVPSAGQGSGPAAQPRFVAEQSTVIQAAFCLQHNMKALEGSEPQKRRTLGFVDSIDVAQRLGNNIHDAEWRDTPSRLSGGTIRQVPLFALRYPAGRPGSDLEAAVRTAVSQYYELDPQQVQAIDVDYESPGPGHRCPRHSSKDCLHPPHHLLERCSAYEDGECWYVSAQRGEEGLRPIAVQVHQSGQRTWGQAGRRWTEQQKDLWRLLISTSALEVGFDNPELIGTWQYHAPPSAASFIQRKGRGGRGIRDYPVTMLVLGAGARDVYCFQDHMSLVHVEDQQITTCLDDDNPSIRDQHVVSAVFDFCASTSGFSGAYELNFEQVQAALQSPELRDWILGCFPSERPGDLSDRLADLSCQVREIWHAPLDLSRLPESLAPREGLVRPLDLVSVGRDRVVLWADALKKAGPVRTYAFLVRRLAVGQDNGKVGNIIDFMRYIPELLLKNPSLRVPTSTIPVPLGREVIIRTPGGQIVAEEAAEFALGQFLPGGFKIRWNGDLWMAPWVRVTDKPPSAGSHRTWAASRAQLEVAFRPSSPHTIAELVEQSNLCQTHREEILKTLGNDCTAVPVTGVCVEALGKVRNRPFWLSDRYLDVVLRRPSNSTESFTELARDPHHTSRFMLVPRRQTGRMLSNNVRSLISDIRYYRQFDISIVYYANLVHCYGRTVTTGGSSGVRTVVVRFWDEEAKKPMAPIVEATSQAVSVEIRDLRQDVARAGAWQPYHQARAFWQRVEGMLLEELVINQGLLHNAYDVPEMVETLRLLEKQAQEYVAMPPTAQQLRDAVRHLESKRASRRFPAKQTQAVTDLADALADILRAASQWARERGMLATVADSLAVALTRAAGRRLNVSPWSFRRLVELTDCGGLIYLFDNFEGGSGNARRLAEELERWPDLLDHIQREISCPVAAVDDVVEKALAGAYSADVLSLFAREGGWPQDWMGAVGDSTSARLVQRLSKLFESPEIAAFNCYLYEQRRALVQEFAGEPSHLRLLHRVYSTPAMDRRADELRLRFLHSEAGDSVTEATSRVRAIMPMCQCACPSCLDAPESDRQYYVDRNMLAKLLIWMNRG